MSSRTTPLIVITVVVVAGIAGIITYAATRGGSSQPSHSMTGMDMSSMDKSSDNSKAVATDSVQISNFAFSPATITVKAGTTVTWTNKDSIKHSATADDNSFDTGLIAQNDSASYTFKKPGTYHYHCTPHPYMKGTVIVTQ